MFSFNDVDCLIILLPCFYNRWCFAPFAFFASLYWSNSRTTRGKTNSSHASISSHTNKLVPAYFLFQEVHCVANEHLFFLSLICGFIVIKRANMCASIARPIHTSCVFFVKRAMNHHWILLFLFCLRILYKRRTLCRERARVQVFNHVYLQRKKR